MSARLPRVQEVRVIHEFTQPVERVFAYLAEHENLGAIFPANVKRVRDGETERNGVGSVRRLSRPGLLPFEETVEVFEPDQRIEYRITKGTPLRDHRGVMLFSSSPSGGSKLDYTIRFRSPVPGVAPLVAAMLRRSVSAGMRKVAAAA
jgi:uncharacterized membrane protein